MSATPRPTEATEIFFSYAHEDADLRDELERHLSILKRQGVITAWHDRKIGAGKEWEGEIDAHLNTAHVILLLVSSDFMDSDYCWDVEVKRAMERHEAGEARVIPVILRPVDWKDAPLGKLRALPKDGKPVATWDNRDQAFLDITQGIRAAVGELTTPKVKTEPALKRVATIARLREEWPPGVHKPFEPEMILIPAGEFLMGSDPEKDPFAYDHEQDQHRLYLPDYHIAKTPVTNAEYYSFVKATGHHPPKHWTGEKSSVKLDHPVVYVSWYDAIEYCRWLYEYTGKPYHLPSETEWEKAARGTDGRIYPWGNWWHPKLCNSAEGNRGGTTPVDAYREGASPYGVLDMAGNVWEWTRNLWGKNKEKPDFKYPCDPADGRENLGAPYYVLRVVRGGSWQNKRSLIRSAFRNYAGPISKVNAIGFRVVISPGSP